MNMWIGVVENRLDPLKLNRAQVRIASIHTEILTTLPTSDLPWMYVLAHLRVVEGDYVVGQFLDEELQTGVVLGVIPGIPDERATVFADVRSESQLATSPKKPASLTITSEGKNVDVQDAVPVRYPALLNEPTISRLARNENIEQSPIQAKKQLVFKSIPTTGGKTFDEPETRYNAVYPYNHVWETESGHVIELDDTPGFERLHIYHRTGTSDEIFPDGTRVSHVNGEHYEIILADKCLYVNGDLNITSKKNINLKCGADFNVEVGGNFNLKSVGKVHVQGLGIVCFSEGALLMQGLPISLNGGTATPLGAANLPIIVNQNSTVVVSPPVQPNPADPGNQTLAQRPGANVGDKKPNELSPPSANVAGIAKPIETNTPAPVITQSEGADVMVRALNRNGITDPTQRAMIYAQAAHESNNFKKLYESFRYTDQGLIATWPSRFNANNVQGYVRQPEKIANFVYANRMGNGNEASGDGWKYRGRGFIQLTGKENYIQASVGLGQDFINFPDAAATPNTAADLAIWYFKSGKKTGYRGSYEDIVAATKFVNGGLNGLEDRKEKFEIAKANTTVITFNTGLA